MYDPAGRLEDRAIRPFLTVLALGATLALAEPRYEHGISFFGAFKYAPDLAHFDYVSPHAPKGGTLVLGSQANWNSFTPLLGKGVPTPGMNVIFESVLYDGLLMGSDDELGTYYGNLAEAVMVPEDFRWARFRLRPEARFHDGMPVTARDVAFTFDHIGRNSWAGVRVAFSMVAATEVHNDREVTFHFHDTGGLNAGVVISLGKVPIIPEHYWRDRDISATTLTPPVGNGPYRVAAAEQGRFLLYQRVPDYWGRELGLNRGRHNFDFIRYDYYRDATVAREAFRKGLIDYRTESDPRYWRHGYEIPALDKGFLVKRRHNYAMYVGILRGLAINARRERLTDLRVREALTLAFDFDWFNRVLNDHFNARVESYFPHTRFAATGLPSPAELAFLEPYRATLPERLFTQPFALPRGDGFGRNREALETARRLLAEAGWNVRDGQLRNAAGEPFELTLLVRTSSDVRLLIHYADQLRLLGFDAKIRLVETAQYVNLLKVFDFDITLNAYGTAQPPTAEVISYFHSDTIDRP
ncbi:MAG: extracellular solute-binding protein, partial [Gammaproteobacteria bacterium]|nr:extracellular solute-binding protein [Gammaproteobacteria bacterium]